MFIVLVLRTLQTTVFEVILAIVMVYIVTGCENQTMAQNPIYVSGENTSSTTAISYESEADYQHGQLLYKRNCSRCHGSDRQGNGSVPSLHNLSGKTDEVLFKTISQGVPGTMMSSWTPNLSNDEIGEILKFLRSKQINMKSEG